VKSYLTDDFIACFRALPPHIRDLARRNYCLWRDNPFHPGLHFRQIHPTEPLYSVRIGIGWRVLGLLEANEITWFWIGSHAEYDRLIRNV
jgi:hypothetical protein